MLRNVCRSKINKRRREQEENVRLILLHAKDSIALPATDFDVTCLCYRFVRSLGATSSCVRGRGIRIRTHEYEEETRCRKGDEERKVVTTTMKIMMERIGRCCSRRYRLSRSKNFIRRGSAFYRKKQPKWSLWTRPSPQWASWHRRFQTAANRRGHNFRNHEHEERNKQEQKQRTYSKGEEVKYHSILSIECSFLKMTTLRERTWRSLLHSC